MSGIRTLEDLRQRCYVDSDSGCWLWRLSVDAGVPRVSMIGQDGREMKSRGRRAGWLLAGNRLPKGHLVFARLSCPDALCVNPDHSQAGTRIQHGLSLSRSGSQKGLPTKIAAGRAASSNRRKLTLEQVQAILGGGQSDYAFATAFGVSQFAVWCVRNRLSWKHVTPQASVFTWRPQA